MGDSAQLINHIESYVNSSATPSQQAASVDAISTLLKSDTITLEALVREMEMYLTSTDSIIRSRGILCLAEVLTRLTSKPLPSTSIHSLIGFFAERLEDWKALRGAIVGCLALLRRKNNVGIVTDSEAIAVVKSYLQNLQVQSLGQHDRKLSFQLMECLLDQYGGVIRELGDNLVYGICEALDGEKDPECLLVVFHIVESLARLYPDPSGPLANYAEDLFGILGCYFPIRFTHPKGEDDDLKTEELSRALMLAFASSPLFEPFCIPLLLEKLSSSLPSAKVDSFKYLSYCAMKYGPDRMAKHAQSLWASIKDAIYVSPQSTLTIESESVAGMNFKESDVMAQAFVLLQEIIRLEGGFISLIIGDNDLTMFVKSINKCKDLDDIPLQMKQRLHAVGHVLFVCAKASVALCNNVFESFFPLLMDALGLSVTKPSKDEDRFSSSKLNFGALYLCIEILGAFRHLAVSHNTFMTIPDLAYQTCYVMLGRFSISLLEVFVSLLRSYIADNAQRAYVYFGVKGLQILATFPGSFLSKSIYDDILLELVSIVASTIDKTFLWTYTVKALVEIGLSNDTCPDCEKVSSFESIVVDRIVTLISSEDSSMPSSLKLQAAFDIGATRKDYMLRVAEGLDKAISTNLSAVYDDGDLQIHRVVVELLDTYSHKLLPWFLETGVFEEIPTNFALNIWDIIENSRPFSLSRQEIANEILSATMKAMKKAVAFCSKEMQEIIINKAFGILLSSNLFDSGSHNYANTCREEWLVSLFASSVIALRPQTTIVNGKMILRLFIENLLHGHIPSAHALGSLVNKLPLEMNGLDSSKNFNLDEALNMIFQSLIGDDNEVDITSLRLDTSKFQSVQIHSVVGLAWICKGLLMRGHEKVKEITLTLLSFLTLDQKAGVSKQIKNLTEVCEGEELYQLMKCSGDAFHIIMSDSESCLNRTYHSIIRPIYKQRFSSTIMPILLSLLVKSESSFHRSMLCRAFAHVVCNTPLPAVLGEAKKLLPVLLNCLGMLSNDVLNKDIVYDVLLVISGILVDRNGQEAATENAPNMVNQLAELTAYPHVMAIRETALQCLVAISQLPYTRIYPLRAQVLRATSKALDDPKRVVRQEAVRCRQAWASISSRSLNL